MSTAGAAADATTLQPDLGRLVRRLISTGRRARRGLDSEAVHDTRVAARRAEAALDVFRDALDRRRRRRARRTLRRLRESLGPAREAEVGAAELAARAPRLSGIERDAAAYLQARLERRRCRLERGVARSCRRSAISQAARRLRRAIRPAAWSGNPGVWLAAAHVRAAARLDRAREALAGPFAGVDDVALHRARIAVKHARYALERLAAAGANVDDRSLAELEPVQQRLGAIHDLVALRQRALRRARRLAASRSELAEGLRAIAKRFEHEAEDLLAGLGAAAPPRARAAGVIEMTARPPRTA